MTLIAFKWSKFTNRTKGWYKVGFVTFSIFSALWIIVITKHVDLSKLVLFDFFYAVFFPLALWIIWIYFNLFLGILL